MKLLTKAMQDEKKAPREYRRLRSKLKSKKDKKVVNSIIKDEIKHLKLLKKIKKQQVGKTIK